MGATSVVDASDGTSGLDELGADVLIECSGATEALEAGLRGLRPGARAVVVGMSPESHVPVPLSLIQWREIELTGTFRYANTYPAAIALAASGAVDLDAIVSGHYPLAEVERALQVGRRDPLAVKPVVLPGLA